MINKEILYQYFVKICSFSILFILVNSTVLYAKKYNFPSTLPIATASFPPFKFRDQLTGKIVGFDTELVTEVFKGIGITPNIDMLPFKRADSKTRMAEYAAYYSFTKNKEREKYYYFSNAISSVQDFIFFNKSSNISWTIYEDLKNLKLGYSEKYNYDKNFLKTIKNKFPILHENNEFHLLSLLVNNRFDMIICEVSVCLYLIKQNPQKFKNVSYFNKPVGIQEPRAFYIGFSKKWPRAKEIRDAFNDSLNKFVSQKNKPRKALFQKYGAPCPKDLFLECK